MCLLLHQVIVGRLSKITLVGFLAVTCVYNMATQNGQLLLRMSRDTPYA